MVGIRLESVPANSGAKTANKRLTQRRKVSAWKASHGTRSLLPAPLLSFLSLFFASWRLCVSSGSRSNGAGNGGDSRAVVRADVGASGSLPVVLARQDL